VRHSLIIDGPAFRLRPVRTEDAAFIAELRADPERCRYLHRGPAGAVWQRRWLEAYFERQDDYYFLIENRATGLPEGTVGIYNAGWSIDGRTDRLQRDAEWGRWVLRRGSLAALESACLLYRVGFETLDLDSIYCRTILENASALAFHDSFGMERGRVLPGYLEREARTSDAERNTRGLDAERNTRGLDAERGTRDLDAERGTRDLDAERGTRDLDAMECRLTRAGWMALREGVEAKALRAAAWSRRPQHAPQPASQRASVHFGSRRLGIKA
jgi:RimJ/RimL family protein N-acetyltransferase